MKATTLLVLALFATITGCASRTIVGAWNIEELPGDKWTFRSDHTYVEMSGKVVYGEGRYELNSSSELTMMPSSGPGLKNVEVLWTDETISLKANKNWLTLHR